MARWWFALRIWSALVFALGTAFWLQLDGASSAGVCVAVLALQTRGQMLEKAAYRVVGTIIGGIAGVILTNAFSQFRDAYVLAYSAWLGLCAFAAGFLDGNRAYGAILCGYTVSIVAIEQIDSPDMVSSAAVARCAAILVGIAAITLVNGFLGLPGLRPALTESVQTAQVRLHTLAAIATSPHGQVTLDTQAGQFLRTVSDWHLNIGALPVEELTGSAQAAAIRVVAAALVGELFAWRLLVRLQTNGESDPSLRALMLRRLTTDLDTCQISVNKGLKALHQGKRPGHAPRLPVYRSWQSALRGGLRAFITSAVSGYVFILAGWPESSFSWGLVGVLICLSANGPDPSALARTAAIAMPMSVIFAGVTLFILLDGSDSFPLLGLGLFLPVVIGTLLLSSPNPEYAPIGVMVTFFTIVVLQPSNPQIYDPLTYCIRSGLLLVTASVVYVGIMTLFPGKESDRREWLINAARRATRSALGDRWRPSMDEARVLDASRIAALATLKDAPAARHAADLGTLFWLADIRAAAQRVWQGLDGLGHGRSAPFEATARMSLRASVQSGLLQLDSSILRRIALAMAKQESPNTLALGADLAIVAYLIDMAPVTRMHGV